MNAYTIQFYDLLTRALGGSESKHIQGFLDDVMARKYNALQLDGFSFDEMQTDFAYEQIQRELSITPMANYYDLDSPALPRGNEGLKSWTGKIPRMKDVEYLNEDKIRKQLLLEQRIAAIGSDRVVRGAMETLFVTLDKLIGGHTNSLTFQRHQMVSKGKFEITFANNPKGVSGLSFSAHVPAGNVTTLTLTKRWWTNADYSTEGNAADPIGDMQAMVDKANTAGLSAFHFEVEKAYFKKILNHSKVLKAIALNLFPTADPTNTTGAVAVMGEDVKKRALEAVVGCPFKVIDSIVSKEAPVKATQDYTIVNMKAFEPNVLVLVPDGNIGRVLTVEPIALPGGTYGSFYDGRLLVTVGVDPVKKCQSFNTEMTSLCVPEVPQYMWYIYPNNV